MIDDTAFLDEYLRLRPAAFAFWRLLEYLGYRRHAPIRSPILDLGCGDGLFGSFLYDGHRAVGIDQERAELAQARERGAYRALGRALADGLPFRTGAFATVVANCVLEHMDNLPGTLREARRVLAPGGALCATVPSEQFGPLLAGGAAASRIGLGPVGRAYGGIINRLLDHRHLLDADTWTRHLGEAGFAEIHCHPLVTRGQLRLFEAGMLLAFPAFVGRRLCGRWIVPPKPYLRGELARWAEPTPERLEDAAAYLIVATGVR